MKWKTLKYKWIKTSENNKLAPEMETMCIEWKRMGTHDCQASFANECQDFNAALTSQPITYSSTLNKQGPGPWQQRLFARRKVNCSLTMAPGAPLYFPCPVLFILPFFPDILVLFLSSAHHSSWNTTFLKGETKFSKLTSLLTISWQTGATAV